MDDDEVDADIIQRAITKQRIANPIVRAHDGLEALEILRGDDGQDGLRRPYLILLDLNMPRMSGIEFLQELRDDKRLHDSIVFVLSSSDDDRDVLKAYEKHVAGYLTKGKFGEPFIEHLNMLQLYWRYIEFPPNR
ncbi:response regulator [Bremerella sp. JC770]|uniref:response regulator n=1 Tax=Bremerella sp. JC770 TaxID=3232137 RepID=UPI00345A8F63